MMQISEIVERFRAEGLLLDFSPGRTDIFDRAECDSRDVGSADCFVAIKGHAADGHAFIDKAVKNGAVAIVCEAAPANSREGLAGAAVVRVNDSRRALLLLASVQAGNPADRLTLVGATGTNGKTTVATLVRRIIEKTGATCGFIGTTGYSVGSTTYSADQTTPSPVRVYDLMQEMERAGCSACSMEVSSHALDQWRVYPSDFDTAVFTNLTRDHLDYHRSEEAYFRAKKRLFDGLSSSATAVTNIDDAAGERMVRDTTARVVTFGLSDRADVRYRIDAEDGTGLELTLDGRALRPRLAGRFNGANVAAAYAVARSLGIEGETAAKALETAPAVAGRFEVVSTRGGRTVIVDYAHTPDALENLLRSARRLVEEGARLWCVFGCGGDGDHGKRPIMGEIAEREADRTVVTSDNPRTETAEIILVDIRKGMVNAESAHFEVDRRAAIRHVAGNSSTGDVIVIAGKGHETVQVVGAERRHFDDREEARRAFDSGPPFPTDR